MFHKCTHKKEHGKDAFCFIFKVLHQQTCLLSPESFYSFITQKKSFIFYFFSDERNEKFCLLFLVMVHKIKVSESKGQTLW